MLFITFRDFAEHRIMAWITRFHHIGQTLSVSDGLPDSFKN